MTHSDLTATTTKHTSAIGVEVKPKAIQSEGTMLKIWMDGQFVNEDEAKVSVFDHGLLYGDGCFEGIRVYNGRIFKLGAHLRRLFASAESLYLEIPYTMDELAKAMRDGVKINEIVNGYIRPVVTRGKGNLGINPAQCPRAGVFIICANIQLYPAEVYETGLKVITSSRPRVSQDALNPAIKSLNYLNNIMAKVESTKAGCHEAVMLNRDGYVAECTGDNIFFVKDGKVVTPALEAGLLAGITRAFAIEICQDLGVPIEEKLFTLEELKGADEIFLTGTAAEIVSVTLFDGERVGDGKPGEMTKKLLAEFRKRTSENAPED